MTQNNNFTTGKIYDSVKKERLVNVGANCSGYSTLQMRLNYLSKRKYRLSSCNIEIGGTVGDIESLPF